MTSDDMLWLGDHLLELADDTAQLGRGWKRAAERGLSEDVVAELLAVTQAITSSIDRVRKLYVVPPSSASST